MGLLIKLRILILMKLGSKEDIGCVESSGFYLFDTKLFSPHPQCD